MKCPKCSKEIPDESRFCMYCGSTASGESLSMPIEEAARLIGCTHQTVLNLIDRGLIDYSARGLHRKTYVTRDSVLAFCEGFPDFSLNLNDLYDLRCENRKAREKMRKLLSRRELNNLLLESNATSTLLLHLCRMYLTPCESDILVGSLIEGQNINNLADELGLTTVRVKQIKEKAIEKLAEVSRKQIDSYFISLNTRQIDAHHVSEIINIEMIPVALLGLTRGAIMQLKRMGVIFLGDIRNVSLSYIVDNTRFPRVLYQILNLIVDYRLKTSGEGDEELLLEELDRIRLYLRSRYESIPRNDDDDDDDDREEAEEIYDEDE